MSRLKWAVFLVAIFMLSVSPLDAATSGTVSVKLSDIPVGKVIQVGELKFVKVGSDQYLSISPCLDTELTIAGAQKLLTYTGNYQEQTFYAGCVYQIELWGAGHGDGNGSYVSGNLSFFNLTNLYIYLGEHKECTDSNEAFNSGSRCVYTNRDYRARAGHGATDIRIISGTWDNADSLRSRVMVAGGAGSSWQQSAAGGLIGYTGGYSAGSPGTGGTQISGCAFGRGCTGSPGSSTDLAGGGGGGWYGGTAGYDWDQSADGGGGSSYISGHTGCVAVTSISSSSPKSGCTTGTTDNSCSISPYGYTFTDTVMIDGAGYQWTNVKGALKQMPNPNGGNYTSGVGHTGNGYARITRLN